MLSEIFFCEITKTKLTRASCGRRWARASFLDANDVAGIPAIYAVTCGGCNTGKEHARGKKPDVLLASIVRAA